MPEKPFDRPADPAAEQLVHRRFGHWAARQPDAPAIVDGGTTLTYAELDAVSSALAARLVRDGARTEDAVAVRMRRGWRVVAAFLGILKAGCCYVPVDPDYPETRRKLLVEGSGSIRVLTEADIDAAAAAEGTAPEPELTGANLAYLVFTSGSTGRPKGVMVEHRNVCALVDEPRLSVRPGETLAQNVSIAFDVAAFEIWATLCHGGRLAIIPNGVSVKELAAEIRRVRPDWMFLTAGVFHLMVEHEPDALGAVGTLQAGGDVLGPAQWCRAAKEPRNALFNAYGPAEATVYSGLYRARPGEELTTVPIGTPPRGEHLVLDPAEPEDGMGEILIGGAGVSRGYRGRPRLTAERFIPDPDARVPGARRYRTGDRGSIRADGSFLVHGRIDRQVKVRGHRVEPAEIENVLAGHPAVAQAAVKPFDVGTEKRLGAFVATAVPDAVPAAELLGWLRDRLPGYMVPAHLRVLDDIPLDPNGKVHRAALPDPFTRRAGMADLDECVPPSTPLEAKLALLWADALCIDEVGVHDNYYLLGGDSLQSIALLARMAELGVEITAEEFFTHQTVAELAELATDREAAMLGQAVP